MTQITGKFVDSGGVAFDGDLTIALDAPLVDTATTPDSIYTLAAHTFNFTSGTLSGVSVVESATSNVTYHFVVNRHTTKTTYWLADGTQYDGPVVIEGSLYYTGTFYDADTSLQLGQVTSTESSVVMDFHAVVPNTLSVEFASLIPSRVSTDSLPRTVRSLAELLTTDADFVEALRGGPRFKGAYSAATYYQRDDSVTYGGSSWVYINADPAANQTPSVINTTYWQLLAQKGDAGGTGGNDTTYDAAGWNGATDAPSRNAVRDIIEQLARITDLASYALLANPALTGNPTCPNQSPGSNNTRIANTAYVDGAIAAVGTVPIGGMIDWALSSAPSKWLLCDGRAISRTTYAALFAAIGTTYGAGNGATTFNIPDYRGRTGIAPDNMGTAQGAASRITSGANNLAGNGGSERVALTGNEMPVHNHAPASGITPSFANAVASGGAAGLSAGTTIATNATTGNAGGGASHENMPPYLVINKIIYAGI
ncbi:phage tail protein [Nostoc linckia]|nr:tail fiber protein [Nostoc linckia]